MMSLASSIDVPGGSDGIYTIPVQHADATQLAQKLNEILGISAGGGRRCRAACGVRRSAARPRERPGCRCPDRRDRGGRRRGAVEDPGRRSHATR